MSQVVYDGWKEEYLALGEAKGRMEKALESALNFLKENISVETVARCTGLPLEKVRELAAGLKKG